MQDVLGLQAGYGVTAGGGKVELRCNAPTHTALGAPYPEFYFRRSPQSPRFAAWRRSIKAAHMRKRPMAAWCSISTLGGSFKQALNAIKSKLPSLGA